MSETTETAVQEQDIMSIVLPAQQPATKKKDHL